MRPIILALAISSYLVYWIVGGGLVDFMPPEPLIVNVNNTATTTKNSTAEADASSTSSQIIQASTSLQVKVKAN